MDINHIDNILVELITLFDIKTLAKLMFVNKKLYTAVINCLCQQLKKRHEQCIMVGDTSDILQFCNQFIEVEVCGTPEFDYDHDIEKKYGYCSCCKQFGLQDMTGYVKKCYPSCVIECCGQNNIIPKELDNNNDTLKCGCKLTSHQTNFDPKTWDCNKVCSCGVNITNTTVKCNNCKKIPWFLKKNDDNKLHDFALGFNFLRIMSGSAGLAYST
jgi:hypothetical protein